LTETGGVDRNSKGSVLEFLKNNLTSHRKFCDEKLKIAYIDIYDPIPINSGGDWYRFQLLSDLACKNDVTEYFTKYVEGKKGYMPGDFKFKREYLKMGSCWDRFFSAQTSKMEMVRPDLLINKSDLKNIKADVVFTLVECYHIARYVSKINGNAPIVVVMHNVEWKYLKGIDSLFHVPMRFYENFVLSRVDAVVAISENEAVYAANYADPEKVFHVPPKKYPLFTPEGEKYSFGKDKFNLLFYGSLDRKQNIEALRFIKMELIPLLKLEKLISNVRINIFGSGDPPGYLELDNDENINFIGTVYDPGKYIRGADLILVPLKNSAGIKFRVIESLACKKPVIATPEAVENLNEDLKEEIYIKENVEGFVEIIKRFVNLEPAIYTS
jgi:glycosyltransferase involved in cell wall biosynthesis